jgi:tetratricopeptide (TPR) repeat protein
MGSVFLARDVVLDRPVALKVLNQDMRTAQARFLRESLLLAGIEHPAVVPVFALAATAEGSPCLVMQAVKGRPWSDVLAESTRRPLEAELGVLGRVCEAVAYAHARGVVHRDLKPENVMVDAFGQVQLLDFGIAFRVGETDFPAEAGTPVYMAPEMADGARERIGPRTDVYLLGAILYELLTGRPPHAAAKGSEPLHAVLLRASKNEVAPPRDAAPKGVFVPEDLARACLRALATDPAARPKDALAFAEEIRRCQTAAAAERESRALATSGRSELETALAVPELAARLPGLERAEGTLERSLALFDRNAEAKVTLARLHREVARVALDRGEVYRATVAAQLLVALEPGDAARADAEAIRLRAFKELFTTFAALRQAVRRNIYVGVFSVGQLAYGLVWIASALSDDVNPSSELPIGELPERSQVPVRVAMGILLIIPSVISWRLFRACLNVRRGSGRHYQRAVRLARSGFHVLLATLFFTTGVYAAGALWTWKPELLAGAIASLVVGGMNLVGPLRLARQFTQDDVNRLPWLDDESFRKVNRVPRWWTATKLALVLAVILACLGYVVATVGFASVGHEIRELLSEGPRPVLTYLTPIPPGGTFVTKEDSVQVAGSIEGKVSRVAVGPPGASASTRVRNGRFEARVPLKEPRTAIEVRAGEAVIGSFTVERDVTPPTIEVAKVPAVWRGGPVLLEVIVKDDHPQNLVARLESVTGYYLDAKSYPLEKDRTEVSVSLSAVDGTVTGETLKVVLEAQDLAGNQAHVERTIRIAPAYGPVSEEGRLLMAEGKLDEALERFRAALAADPEVAAPHADIALALAAKGDREGALGELEAACAAGFTDGPSVLVGLEELLAEPRLRALLTKLGVSDALLHASALGIQGEKIPPALLEKLCDLVATGRTVKQVAFTQTDGWVVLHDKGWVGEGLPEAAIAALDADKEKLQAVGFPGENGWVVVGETLAHANAPEELTGFLEQFIASGSPVRFAARGNSAILGVDARTWALGGIANQNDLTERVATESDGTAVPIDAAAVGAGFGVVSLQGKPPLASTGTPASLKFAMSRAAAREEEIVAYGFPSGGWLLLRKKP